MDEREKKERTQVATHASGWWRVEQGGGQHNAVDAVEQGIEPRGLCIEPGGVCG